MTPNQIANYKQNVCNILFYINMICSLVLGSKKLLKLKLQFMLIQTCLLAIFLVYGTKKVKFNKESSHLVCQSGEGHKFFQIATLLYQQCVQIHSELAFRLSYIFQIVMIQPQLNISMYSQVSNKRTCLFIKFGF